VRFIAPCICTQCTNQHKNATCFSLLTYAQMTFKFILPLPGDWRKIPNSFVGIHVNSLARQNKQDVLQLHLGPNPGLDPSRNPGPSMGQISRHGVIDSDPNCRCMALSLRQQSVRFLDERRK